MRNAKRSPRPSFGTDFITEVRSRLHLSPRVIFDVGAHIGMTALEFSDAFPEAKIYAFEPSTENFHRMRANLVGTSNVQFVQLGIADSNSSASLSMDPAHPSMASVAHTAPGGTTEAIDLVTLDDYCRQNAIARIDIMKIDTEGYEMQALRGATRLLTAGAIGVIKAEVALDPDSNYHTSLFEFSDYLHRFGYRLFGFYDQSEDTLSSGPRLRRFDAAFVLKNSR
ncbi:FkbM family methyltransferase [Bradyrhizobium roseum]|nr:FkbM family methyltransferase [Bradyrhizobium roseus]